MVAASESDGGRLIIPRAVGLRGHVAGGFCGDMSTLQTQHLACFPPDCCCPSLCQKEKGLSEPLVLPENPSWVLCGLC